jgi:broad specificity phosphatase PhoE
MVARAFHEGVPLLELRTLPTSGDLRRMTSRMVLLRHGATEWSQSGQHTGRTDIPLLDLGREQAKAAGELLHGMRFVQVFTSPLRRASATCSLAGFDGDPEPDLVEWDYGAYEGQTSAQICADRPGWTLWNDGVIDGERAADVGRRVDRVIERARQVDGDTLCVAHGHVLRVLTARWVGLPPVAGRLFALATGTVSIMGWERDTPVVARWNVGPPGSPL